MKDPALMTRWERAYWLIRLRAKLFLNDAGRWVRRDLLRVPRDEVTEGWLENMSPAELEELGQLMELVEKGGAVPKTPQPPPVPFGRSIFDHDGSGRFLDEQLSRKPR